MLLNYELLNFYIRMYFAVLFSWSRIAIDYMEKNWLQPWWHSMVEGSKCLPKNVKNKKQKKKKSERSEDFHDLKAQINEGTDMLGMMMTECQHLIR